MSDPHGETSTETIELRVDDGTELGLYVAHPAVPHEARGAIIVLQEIFGVNEHIRDVTRRFAELGYVAAAPDLFHRTAPGFQGSYDDPKEGRRHANDASSGGIGVNLRATHAWLSGHARRVAAVGFCMGGRQAFAANGILPLACAVSFYGANIQALSELVPSQRGPLLTIWGGKDQHIGREQPRQVADMLADAGKRHVDITFGEADHGFFCDARAAYHPPSATQAWALVRAFLEASLG